MVVDLILKAGVTRHICSWLAFEHDGTSVRQNETRPDQEYTRLPECNLAIIDPDQSRALWNQAGSPGRSIVDIFCHLRRDLTRQLGANSSNKSRGNDSAGLNNKGRGRLHQT